MARMRTRHKTALTATPSLTTLMESLHSPVQRVTAPREQLFPRGGFCLDGNRCDFARFQHQGLPAGIRQPQIQGHQVGALTAANKRHLH